MKKNIMIVDDDPDCRNSVKQALESMDNEYEVICVSSGIQCLELLKNKEFPDLILLDIMMPKMSGWETFLNIQENQLWKHIPVIFLTVRDDDFAKNSGKFLAADFIKKPYQIEDLKMRIDNVLNNADKI
jgi:DNA-binding response OmpR family regulator